MAKPPASEATANRAEAGEEHPPAPSRSASAPAEEQKAAEQQRVGVDDPLQAVASNPRSVGCGQRDVHDRHVEDDHELGDREHREDLPTPRIEK